MSSDPRSIGDGGGGEAIDPRAEAQARLAAIIESSDDAIVSKTLDGVITSWNKGAERIFGWTSAEALGKPITIIIPPDRLGEEPEILRRIRAGERVDHFETVRMTRDGRMLDISVTISPVRDERGTVIGVSKIARDITAQKRSGRELQAAKEAAEHAREMAEQANRAKDHFLSVLSHELRTPLTPVLLAVSLLEADDTLPPLLADQVSMIRRNIETEARLVDDLLDLTRIARGKIQLRPEVVDAHAVIRNVVAMFQGDVDEKGLAVTVSLRAKRHHVWADAGRFQQVLLNLMSNAVKFTPAEGSIAVRTSNENGTIRIEVADTGIGIEPEVMPRLFEPFEQGEKTTTRKFGGLGLGLSIVKSLVEMHRASITASSEGLGRGATFTLRIEAVEPGAKGPGAAWGGTTTAGAALAGPQPLGPAPATAGATSESTGPRDVAARRRVLLVEDHADSREMLYLLLTNLGCDVTAVGSVGEAIETAARQQFDLLVSDIGLPDGSGTDVMRHVAERHGGMKGIALSGYGQDEDLRRSEAAGFFTHLVKPVSLKELDEVLRRVRE